MQLDSETVLVQGEFVIFELHIGKIGDEFHIFNKNDMIAKYLPKYFVTICALKLINIVLKD